MSGREDELRARLARLESEFEAAIGEAVSSALI